MTTLRTSALAALIALVCTLSPARAQPAEPNPAARAADTSAQTPDQPAGQTPSQTPSQTSADPSTIIPAGPGPAAALPTDDLIDLPLEQISPLVLETDVVKIRVRPLNRAELQKVAEAWVGELRVTANTLAAVQIQLLKATGDIRARLTLEETNLEFQRNRIAERLGIVISSMQAKGADAKELDAYVKAVSASAPTFGSPAALWIKLRTWLTDSEGGIQLGLNLLKAIFTLLAFWIAGRIIAFAVTKAVGRFKGASQLLKNFLAGLSARIVYIIGFVVAVSMLGFNIGPLVAAIGAAGLVIGLALQGTLSNFASGILILLYRPFDVGDVITAAGVTAKVTNMTLVSTAVTTGDNQKITIPNNAVWNGVITNITGNPTRRVDMTFGISYSDDIGKAMSIIQEVVTSHPLTHKDPAPVIQVAKLGESSVDIICRVWANTPDYWMVFWECTRRVKEGFDAQDITIPFPQRDLHVYHHGGEAPRLAPGAAG